MIKIAVAGAEGRMGRLITELVQADSNTELTNKLIRSNSNNPLNSTTNILIDFSHKEALLDHATLCAAQNIGMVIGITGLETEQISAIHQFSKTIPIVMSPNMSIGVNITFKLLEMVTRLLKESENQKTQTQTQTQTKTQTPTTDIAITEIHHRHKKDAPSGTAKRMGEIIASQLGKTLEQSGIQFSSLRLGEVMGDHRALFAFEGEQLEITHKAEDRIIFARGAMLAAKWLYGKPPGLYDMQDVLGL